MNRCFFIGNFVADPEVHELERTKVVNFCLAVNRYHKKANGQKIREKAFINCEVWDSAADAILNRFKKGDRIAVESSARTETWKSKDGQNRSKLKFRVEHFYPIELEPDDYEDELLETAA